MTDLMLVSDLDQPVHTDNTWYLKRIETIVERSIDEKDLMIALNACKSLVELSKVSGLTLAKGLYLIQLSWDTYGVSGNFDDIVHEYLGLHKHTVERYTKVWALFAEDNVPEELETQLQQRNIKDLVPIANMVAQGYKVKKKQWKTLVQAPDYNTVSRLVREIKEKPPRKSALVIMLKRNGDLYAYKGDNEPAFIGYLAISEDNTVGKQAIERILKNSGILLR